MLLTKFHKSIIQKTLYQLKVHHVNSINMRTVVNCCNSKIKFLQTCPSNLSVQRNISYDSQIHTEIWPFTFTSLLILFKNFWLLKMEKDFNTAEFKAGARQALVVISHALAREDYDSIQGLVTNDVIQNLKNKISTLSLEQKELIAVAMDDIQCCVPYQIEIKSDNNKANQKCVEIAVVFHSYLNFQQSIAEISKGPDMNKFYVTHYGFIREFIEGVDTSWMINFIYHSAFSPKVKENPFEKDN